MTLFVPTAAVAALIAVVALLVHELTRRLDVARTHDERDRRQDTVFTLVRSGALSPEQATTILAQPIGPAITPIEPPTFAIAPRQRAPGVTWTLRKNASSGEGRGP